MQTVLIPWDVCLRKEIYRGHESLGVMLIAVKPCNRKESLKRESLISLGYSQGPEGISNMAVSSSVLAAVSGPNDTQSCGPPWTEFLSSSYLTLDWGPHFVNKLSMNFPELKTGLAPGASSTKVRKEVRDLGLSDVSWGSPSLFTHCAHNTPELGSVRFLPPYLPQTQDVNTVYALCFWPLSDSESESCSFVGLFVTPWTIQSMEFSRPEYWNG